MPQLIDCYFLIDFRNRKVVNDFLDEFIPDREETCDDYIVSSNSNIFDCADELMGFLEQSVNEDKTIYWENRNKMNVIKFAMAFFTDDGKIILGVSMKGKSPRDILIQEKYFEVKTYLKASVGCITIEEVAPTNSLEFIEFCEDRYSPTSDE
jgi:hypothetical protein